MHLILFVCTLFTLDIQTPYLITVLVLILNKTTILPADASQHVGHDGLVSLTLVS